MKRERTVKRFARERTQEPSKESYLELEMYGSKSKADSMVKLLRGNDNTKTLLQLIYHLALLGATDEMIAKSLGIGLVRFNALKAQRVDLAKTLQEGRINADTHVTQAMYHAALGYSHEDEVILSNRVKEFDQMGRVVREYNEPIRLKTIKHYPPNAKLILRWLQIRQPDIWADKRADINNNILNITNINLQTLSDQELQLMAKLGLDNKAIGNGNFAPPEIVYQEFDESPINDEEDGYGNEVFEE